jgi:predicted ATPase
LILLIPCRLLQGTHVGERMQKIWGNAVHASAKALKKSFQDLLREYLVDGGDVAEAAQALRELDVPTVHYRFVKAAVEVSDATAACDSLTACCRLA